MSETDDLFPGFTSQSIDTPGGASIFVRAKLDAGKPPLLLLHGYPQTHHEWHRVAPSLTPHFSVVLMDLRGYGQSSPVPSTNGSGYSKRLMAQDCVAVMKSLGFDKFSVVGHDRGARVAYRLAFDQPEVLTRAAAVDIVPTATMFRSFGDPAAALRAYHWLLLAQPAPLPEKMITGADGGLAFLERSLASWSKGKDLASYDATALEEYRQAFCDEARIHAGCEDYRAGAYLDRVYDEEDLAKGNKIKTPLLAVWGATGVFAEAMEAKKEGGPLEKWQQFAENVTGVALDCGHFIPEEDPEGLMKALLPFLLEN